MKHEYTDSELAELKNIYDEQGEAGLSITEMRAYARPDSSRKAFRRNRRNRRNAISSSRTAKTHRPSQPFDGKETAETLGLSQKTVGNILSQLRKEGLLPAFDKHSPRKTRETTTTGKKEES